MYKHCGKDHLLGKHLARGAVCFKCTEKGHLAPQCLTTTLATTTQEQGVDATFLHVGALDAGQLSAWSTTLKLNGQGVNFKLDIGAEVTAISIKLVHNVREYTSSKQLPACSTDEHSSLQHALQTSTAATHSPGRE